MREDYNKGWSFGEHLDTRIVPFAGKGFDPRRLVGCRVVYYRQVGPGYENGPFGSANVEIVGEGFSGCILVKAFSTDGWLDTMLEIDSGCIEFPHLTGIDSEARPIFSEPKKVIEAASGLRRNLCGQIISRVVGLRLEGMHHMSFLSGLKSKWTPNWVVGNFDVCLVDTQSLLTPIQSEGEKAEHKVAVIEYCPQDEDSSSEPTSAS